MPLIPYLPGAEPYFHFGSTVGVLGIHGFAASPAEVRWMGEYLAAQGFTVYLPRLAGHGTTPRDHARTGWRDWYATVLDAVAVLRAHCQRIVVVGHSMGGMLALLLASEHPVDAVAVLAAPIQFRARTIRAARWLKYPLPYTHQPDKTGLPERLRVEQARRGEPVLGRVRYDRWSTAALAQMVALSDLAYARLPLVSAPLLLVYSQADRTAPPEHADLITARVGSTSIERHTLTICEHIVTQDSERDEVFRLVADFAARQG